MADLFSHSSEKEMKALILRGDRQCELLIKTIPKPGHSQVLIQMRASGLCGSDLRLIYRPKEHKSGPDGYQGVVAGHEPCGIIMQRGEGVLDAWKEGTRVVVYHIQGCGFCHLCREGRYISCNETERKAYGWQRDGGHAEYLLADVQSLVCLPEPLTYIDGAIIACGLGTAYAACKRADISGRDRVLVTGLGPVGLGVALVAQCMGAKVFGIEYDAERVMFATTIGIECVECVKQGDDNGDVKAVMAWAGGLGPDVTIDCSGNESGRLTCLKAARVWGRVVFVGEGGSVSFDVSDVVIHKNLSIYGSWVCSIGEMEELVERLVHWNLHPEIIVTNTFTVDEAALGYQVFDQGNTGKCVIVYEGERQVHKAVV